MVFHGGCRAQGIWIHGTWVTTCSPPSSRTKLDDFTNRIMIALTAQLVLAALFTSTTQSSVKTPYLKLIDVWYAAVITFCFIIIISQTLINVLLHSMSLPSVLLRVVRMRPPYLQSDKQQPFRPAVVESESKAFPGEASVINYQVAQRYNSLFRIVIFTVAAVFVFFYIMMAMGVI
ncbi:hypothetical protein Pcinc_033254 [Petrolisthes cinctipes]|uniref:Neurotransmitter-gated ion-channel transmembrane domain-containing protein n=1 Tax=Petrolisthes cinctipes TaxID=88211 RepID=A0AAE1ESM0_PETCI|nr:hypothetical protein Pcinc_033254 [Petrolisthes cinctipes]